MKNINKKSTYYDGKYHDIINGTIGLLCKYCKKISYKEINVSIDSECIPTINLLYNCVCDNCNKMITHAKPIDPNIAETIAILNNKGYYVANASEGHIDYYFAKDIPYIHFAFNHQYKVLYKHPLPENWVWTTEDEEDNNLFIIKDNKFEDIDINNILEYKKHTLNLIREWAESLSTSEELKLNYHNGNLINDNMLI